MGKDIDDVKMQPIWGSSLRLIALPNLLHRKFDNEKAKKRTSLEVRFVVAPRRRAFLPQAPNDWGINGTPVPLVLGGG